MSNTVCIPGRSRIVKIERARMRSRCVSWTMGVCLSCAVFAQQRAMPVLVLKAQVEGGEVPLAGAVVHWDEQHGVTTDEQGRCTVPWDGRSEVVLSVGHTSCLPHDERFGPRSPLTDGAWRVVLEERVTWLPVTEVGRTLPEVVFNRPDLHAADLLINQEGIWVLAYERPRMVRSEADQSREILRGVRLVLLDTTFAEVASVPVQEDVYGLRRDMHNAVVIEGTSHAFGVGRRGDGLALVPFGLEDLRTQVLPWTDSLAGHVLGSNDDRIRPRFDYLAYDPFADSAAVVCTVVDTFMMELFRSEYKYMSGHDKVVAMNLAAELGVDKQVVAGYMSGFQHNLWFKPVYAPMFVVGDTMLVFDHARGRLRKFDRAMKEVNSIPLPYLPGARAKELPVRLLQDRRTQRIYALFQRNGWAWLRAVDPSSGALGERHAITYRYPERVQVWGDAVHYVYRPFESLQKRSIYRERL